MSSGFEIHYANPFGGFVKGRSSLIVGEKLQPTFPHSVMSIFDLKRHNYVLHLVLQIDYGLRLMIITMAEKGSHCNRV